MSCCLLRSASYKSGEIFKSANPLEPQSGISPSVTSPDLPGVLAWRIYSACLCTLITRQICMTPGTSKPAPSICSHSGPSTLLQDSGEKVHSDKAGMFIPRFYSFESQETSLAYHISSCMHLHLDTEKALQTGV